MSEKELIGPDSEANAAPLEGFITEEEFARRINRVQKTAWLWRRTGLGPKPTFIGRDVYYAEDAVSEWLSLGGTRGGGVKAAPRIRKSVRVATAEPKRRGRPKKVA